MIDETGCEFGVSVPDVPSRAAAYEWLAENYPESRCDQLETPEEARAREDRYYDDAMRGAVYDDDGALMYYENDDYEDEEDEDEEYVDDSEERFTDHADEPYQVEDSYLDSSYEEE
jgi:hypothetical protein